MMKFVLQLHKLPKFLEQKCGERMGALENQADQTWTSHQVTFLDDMNSVAATHWTTREVCSMKQRQNFKGIKGQVTSIGKNIRRMFGATRKMFNKKSKSNRLRVERMLKV